MMSRQFRFRIWDLEDNQMCGPYDLTDSFYNHTSNRGKSPIVAPLMQFTGLLDKNEIEIYEGDILKYVLEGMEPLEFTEYTEEVVFTNGCFELNGCPLYVGNEIGEVIGNIYQHKHLLS